MNIFRNFANLIETRRSSFISF